MQNRHVIELSPSGKTFDANQELLLDAMLASGLPVPFSCRRGACGSCKVKVVSGQYRDKQRAADMPAPCYPLADDEMLLCQSHACSDMCLEIPGWSLETQTLKIHAQVHVKRELSADIIELVLQPAQPLSVRAGQYVRFRLDNGDTGRTGGCLHLAARGPAPPGTVRHRYRLRWHQTIAADRPGR